MSKDTHARLKSEGYIMDDQGNFIGKKKVAVFGSARTNPNGSLYKAIEEMSSQLSKDGWIVVTGGGPGSMEAANKGANQACIEDDLCTIAHAIYLPFEEEINEYVQDFTKHEEFYSRLKTFSECDAFIVTPGGIGTLLEMALIYQLMQVGHLKTKPVICVGRMWRSLREWIENEMLESAFLNREELDLIHYVDRFSEAKALLDGLNTNRI